MTTEFQFTFLYHLYQKYYLVLLSRHLLFILSLLIIFIGHMKTSSLQTQLKLILQWKNLSLIDKKYNQPVLNNLNGHIQSGQFLTIMGPSGAGKSSFLSIITSKLSSYSSNFNVKGKTTLNGSKYTEQQFISIASYVPQDDLLMQTLTVEETLNFQARLKLSDLSEQQRAARVLEILKMLNLYEIRNSYVGGRQKKSISGGQKKRVVISVQLISNPMILILDQPTSGLDSFNSLKIIKILSNLAKQQHKLIIATIHQPSSLMFQNFDSLMVLKSGQQVYHDQANKIVNYMQNLNIKVDYRMNPADFFMLELSSFKQLQGHTTNMTAQVWRNHLISQNKGTKKSVVHDQLQKIDFNQHPPTPLTQQFRPLIVRNMKSFIRTPSNQYGRLLQMICYPLFIGLLYYDILSQIPDLTDPQKFEVFLAKFACFVFLGLFFTIGQTIYDTMLVFPAQKQLILKQVHSNMYSLNMYFTSKLIIEIPGMLFPIWVATTLVYIVTGLSNQFSDWFLYEFIFTLTALSGYLIGIIAGILCKQPNFAIQASPFIVMPLVVFGGLVVNLKSIPIYSSWIQYVTPLRYGFNVLANSQLNTDALHHLGSLQFVIQKLGLSGHNSDNIIQLSLLCYGFFVVSFVVLYMRRKFN